MAAMARGRLKRKAPALQRALVGRLTAVQRWILQELLDRYEELEDTIARVDAHIWQEVGQSPDPFVAEAIGLLDMILSVGE
jgi:hypothetical protein